jgi:hypothetical protein
MEMSISGASCLGAGSWPEVIAKSFHPAGEITIIRATGGRHVWMPSLDASRMCPGARLKVSGGGIPLMGMESLPIERAVAVASQESLFEEDSAEFDPDGLPLCPHCRIGMDWEEAGFRETETMGGHGVEYLRCPECGQAFELVANKRLYPAEAASRGRGRGRRVSQMVAVGASQQVPESVDVGAVPRTPGVAMGKGADGIFVELVNPTAEASASVRSALAGFGGAVREEDSRWTIDMSRPFSGAIGPAYVSLVKIHELISMRGVPPGLFRDLRDWVAGRS